MTGTVLQVVPIVDLFTTVDLDLQFSSKGEVKVGDSLEIPALNETRKVKSIQMFRVRQNKIKKKIKWIKIQLCPGVGGQNPWRRPSRHLCHTI